MTRLREWVSRLWNTLRPGRRDEDLEEELRLHVELAVEDEQRRSSSGDGAERAVAMRLGGRSQAMEALRDRRGLPWLDELGRDVRYAVRTLRKSPSFTAVAVLTLALGIGATTAIYSVVDTILLQPLPFADSDRLVRVVENVPTAMPARPLMQRGVNYQEFLEWRTRTQTLSDVIAVTGLGGTVRTGEGTAQLFGAMTSVDTFTTLGVRAILGRTLGPGDDADPSVVVLGFDTWRRHFQADPGVVGTTIELRAPEQLEGPRPLTVIGVLPAGFEFPTERMDFYTPLIPDNRLLGSASVTLIGRLRPDVPLNAAMDEANVIGTAIRPPPRANAPPLSVPRFEVQVLKDQIVQGLRPALRVLLAAVAVVLTIVCANVANLLLARASARQREMAVRLAIGASRGRVVRQVLTECLVLAIAGGALGALFGAAGVTLVKRLATVDVQGIFQLMFGATILPRGNEVNVDLKMFGIAFGIAAITSLVFGVLPALHLSRTSQFQALGMRGGGARRGEASVRAALVVGQLVMATVLLVGAGLLVNSFVKLSTVEKGYDPSNVLAVQLVFPTAYSISRKVDTIEALLERLRAAPNVESAGFSRAGVLIGEEITQGTFVPQGRTLDDMRADPERPRLRSVSEGFLTAMGISLLAGREFSASDDATSPPVIVINRSTASQLFGVANAVGQFLDWHVGKAHTQVQVVGIVEEVRNESLVHEPFPEVFIDYRQLLALQQRWGDPTERSDRIAIGFLSFVARTTGDPASAIPSISQIVRAVDPNAGIDAIVPMERLVSSSLARERFYAVMLSLFASIAALLAAIGVYGVLAYAVIQRTQEIGVRMALGARRAQVLALVLRKGMILTISGVALGLVGAVAGTRFLQGLLFGITPLDPMTFLAVSLVFGFVALFASYLPARRATRVDPMIALRSE